MARSMCMSRAARAALCVCLRLRGCLPRRRRRCLPAPPPPPLPPAAAAALALLFHRRRKQRPTAGQLEKGGGPGGPELPGDGVAGGGQNASIQSPALETVLVPGLTDDPANVEGLSDFVASLKMVERVEVAPFHKMGEFKWKELRLRYELADTQPPTRESVIQVHQMFKSRGLTVV